MVFSLFVRYDRCNPLVAYCYSVVACHSYTFLWIVFFSFFRFLSLLAPGLQVIYVWQYETNSVIMSEGNWIWGFRAASGRNLQINLDRRKTPCWIHSLVTLPARLSHYEGQRGREMREKTKAPTGPGLRNEKRTEEWRPKTKGTNRDGEHSKWRYWQRPFS